MSKLADSIFVVTGSYEKAKEKHLIELTNEELCIIYSWMCAMENLGDEPLESEDDTERSLACRLRDMLKWYTKRPCTDEEYAEQEERRKILANKRKEEVM